jgi:hypothetical protein
MVGLKNTMQNEAYLTPIQGKIDLSHYSV